MIKNTVYIVGGDEIYIASERLAPTGNWQELRRRSRPRLGFATAVIADMLYVCGGPQASVDGVMLWNTGVALDSAIDLRRQSP